MPKCKTLKGYARVDCRGVPDLCTFTRDVTKSGNTEWELIEVRFSGCGEPCITGNEMIDYNYNLTKVVVGADTLYKTRKLFISGSTKVWRDGILMTPNDGTSDTYDYTEVGNNKIKFNFVFDYANTNITIIYETI